MSTGGYDYSIRQGLNQNGISDDRITYNPNQGVMVDGNTFYKPEKVYQGSSFTNQNNFNQAWNDYNKTYNNQSTNQQTTPTQYNSYNPYSNSSMNSNPYTSQADDIIKQLLNYNQNQQQFDPYSTSAYQAAQAQANRAAQQNTRAAQEAYGSAGFGRSSAMGERIAGIQNDATEYLMTQVLPQIEAQEQARRQQGFNNLLSALNPLMSQQGRADNLVQQDFNNRITEGQLTGNYINPEAAYLINQIMDLKNQAEVKGLPNTDVKALSAQADQYRNRLAELGYDPSMFGSGINAAQAGLNRNIASRTLQGQTLDYNKMTDQRDFDRGVLESDRNFERSVLESDRNYAIQMANLTGTLPDGSKTTAEQQRQLSNLWMVAQQTGTIPNELADMYGIKRGTRTQDAIAQAEQIALGWANHKVSQQNANTSSYSAQTSRMNANHSQLMDLWQATGVAPKGIPGVPAGTPYASYKGASNQTSIPSKESSQNLNQAKSYMKNMSYEDALAYITNPQVKEYLNDTDFRAALKFIEDREEEY